MKKILFCVMMTCSLLISACASSPTATTTDTTNNQQGVTTLYRTIPERVNDELIERISHKNLPNIAGVSEHNVRIAINSFRREVLLTGEVPSEQVKQDVEKMVRSISEVKKVYNNLTVTDTPKSQSHTVHENYLKSKIIAKIVSTGSIKSSQYKLVVRNNMAYLIAFLTAEQEKLVMQSIEAVQGIEGVRMFGVQINGNASLLNTTNLDNEADTDGIIYGGQITAQDSTPFPILPMPSTPATTPKTNTGYNNPAPVVRMDGNPKSAYIQLYNNTSKP